MVGYSPALIFQVMFLGSLVEKIERKIMIHMGTAHVNKDDLFFLKELLETGKLVSVIDRHYPLEEVAKALQYLDQKHARGKVVISVNK
jgi:NADPH:quinone reductase-like Zn-dependent oxidoreductase